MLEAMQANTVDMVQTIKLYWLVQLNTQGNGVDFEKDCVQFTTILGDLLMGRENDFRNVPPQMAQNKGNLQLHAVPWTTIHSLCISFCGVHEFIYLFIFNFMR